MAEYIATSGSYKTILTVSETGTPDTTNNTSTVQFNLVLKKEGGTGLWNSDPCYWSININGTPYSGSFTYDFRSTTSITLKSNTTLTITHDSDGSKKIAVSASVDMDNTPYVYTMSPSGELTLTTIPRASDISLSVSSFTVTSSSGNAFQFTITPKTNTFYNRMRYTLGSTSWSGNYGTGTKTGNFNNQELLNSLPTATSGTLTVYCDTYSDSGYANLVGTKSVAIPINIDTNYIKPTISLGNLSINTSYISGYAVAWYSKVQSAWSATVGYGATSKTTYFSSNYGTLQTTSSTDNSGTVISDWTPQSSTDYTFTISAYTKDSRGAISNTVSKSIQVWGYQSPTATIRAYRVADNTSTTEDGSGQYVYVTFGGTVKSSIDGQNTIQSATCTASGYITGNVTNGQHFALPETQSATFNVTVKDKMATSRASVVVGTVRYALDLLDDGNGNVGVGLGGLASSGYVFSPLNASLAQQSDGTAYFTVGNPDKATGRTYSNFRAGGGTYYIGNGERGSNWVAWGTAINEATSSKEIWNVNQNLDVNFNGNLNGNATTSTTATNANNVNIQAENPSSSTTRYVPFVAGEGNRALNYNDGLRLFLRNGTASSEGYSELTLGNGTAIGTADNKTGWLRLHAPTGYYAEITAASNLSANRIIYFPNIGGTLAIANTTLWENKLLGGNSQLIDMTAYSRIRVYAMTWGVQHVFEIDLSESGKAVSGSGLTDSSWPWQGGSTVPHRDGAGTTGGHLTYYSVSCKVGSDKKSIWVTSIGYQNIQSSYNAYVQALNNNQYYVYRVDGII